jgi:type II secretory pathway component PulK
MKANPTFTRNRRGFTAIIAVGTVVLIGLMAGVLVRQSMMLDRRMKEDERQAQADWLVQAGLERAWARLGADDTYVGETWAIEPGQLGDEPGRVEIEIARGDDEGRQVRVVASYPADGPRAARSSGTFQVELGSDDEGGAP